METKKIDSNVKPVFKSNEEQLETEDDERVADLETHNENDRNVERQDAEDLQVPGRSNRTRKSQEDCQSVGFRTASNGCINSVS